MATSISAYILIIDLNSEDNTPHILRKFEHHRLQNTSIGRVIRGIKPSEDIVMDDESNAPESDERGVDSDSEESEEEESQTKSCTITRMAVSSDGQWLATSDDQSRTHIFNLDAIQVSSPRSSILSGPLSIQILLAPLYAPFLPPSNSRVRF